MEGCIWVFIWRVFELVCLINVFKSVVVCWIFVGFVIKICLKVEVWRVYLCVFFDSVVFVVLFDGFFYYIS